MLTIQVQTIGGQFINNARWQIDSTAYLLDNQDYFVSMNIEDKNFLEELKKIVPKDRSVSVEKYSSEDAGKSKLGSYVVLGLKVLQIKHMFDVNKNELESIVILTPNSRVVEGIITYIYDKDKCDQRFLKFLKST